MSKHLFEENCIPVYPGQLIVYSYLCFAYRPTLSSADTAPLLLSAHVWAEVHFYTVLRVTATFHVPTQISLKYQWR